MEWRCLLRLQAVQQSAVHIGWRSHEDNGAVFVIGSRISALLVSFTEVTVLKLSLEMQHTLGRSSLLTQLIRSMVCANLNLPHA